ncbi:MAG TPA: hypothetical protein VG733_18455 [Chthoniobacteraceae bacterium]|nr:hypothetical protein [Verrucomicrobiae bacterium]HWB61470.1 hypothetical protein [Chthoniobacteraceae bacterium]
MDENTPREGLCDLCSAPLSTGAKLVFAPEMCVIARNGYGVHVPFGPAAGRAEALVTLAEKTNSPWAVCSSCYERTRGYLQPVANTRQSTPPKAEKSIPRKPASKPRERPKLVCLLEGFVLWGILIALVSYSRSEGQEKQTGWLGLGLICLVLRLGSSRFMFPAFLCAILAIFAGGLSYDVITNPKHEEPSWVPPLLVGLTALALLGFSKIKLKPGTSAGSFREQLSAALWYILKIVPTLLIGSCIFTAIQDTAWVRGATGDAVPYIIALFTSIVVAVWTYFVIWRPIQSGEQV